MDLLLNTAAVESYAFSNSPIFLSDCFFFSFRPKKLFHLTLIKPGEFGVHISENSQRVGVSSSYLTIAVHLICSNVTYGPSGYDTLGPVLTSIFILCQCAFSKSCCSWAYELSFPRSNVTFTFLEHVEIRCW